MPLRIYVFASKSFDVYVDSAILHKDATKQLHIGLLMLLCTGVLAYEYK